MILSLLALCLFALGTVIAYWWHAERRYRRRFITLAESGPASGLSWEQRMHVRRAYDRMNLGTALAIVILLGVTVWCGYRQYVSLIEDEAPPVVSVATPGAMPAGASPGTGGARLYWTADYPGGRLYPVLLDGGLVLFRAIRGKYDQYLLYSSSGDLLWRGERGYQAPAPRTAVRAEAGEIFLAVEAGLAATDVLVFSQDGQCHAGASLEAFPEDDDEWWFPVKTSDRETHSRPVSPDGQWRVEASMRVSRGWFGSRLRLFGPGA